MEMFSTFAGLDSKALDTALAKEFIKYIGGDCWRGKGNMLDRVFRTIQDRLPNERGDLWTQRRVRAFWHGEAASVKFHEMVDLANVAAAERIRRDELREARFAHAEFKDQTANLAAFLERQDADFHRYQVAAMRRAVGPNGSMAADNGDQVECLDSPGIEGR